MEFYSSKQNVFTEKNKEDIMLRMCGLLGFIFLTKMFLFKHSGNT